jgi:hypothetical protein
MRIVYPLEPINLNKGRPELLPLGNSFRQHGDKGGIVGKVRKRIAHLFHANTLRYSLLQRLERALDLFVSLSSRIFHH